MDNVIPDSAVDGGAEESAPQPPRAWRRTALAVPVLAVGALVAFGFFVSLSNARDPKASAACHYLPVSWVFRLLGYGSCAAAVTAVTLHLVLRRTAKARGWDPRAVWQGGASDGGAVLAWVAVVLTALAVWNVVDAQSQYDADHGRNFCEGMAVPGR